MTSLVKQLSSYILWIMKCSLENNDMLKTLSESLWNLKLRKNHNISKFPKRLKVRKMRMKMRMTKIHRKRAQKIQILILTTTKS